MAQKQDDKPPEKQPRDKGKGVSLSLMARLWRGYMVCYWPQLAAAVLFMVTLAAAEAMFPVIIEWVFASFDTGRQATADGGRSFMDYIPLEPTPRNVMIWGPVLLLTAGCLNAASQYLYSLSTNAAAIGVLRDLQKAMFGNFLNYDYAQTREDGSGQLVSRFTNDTTTLRESLTRVPNAIRDIFRLLVLLTMMALYDWVLFLIVALIYPTIGLPVTWIGKRLRKYAGGVQNQIGDMTGQLAESMRGARMVKTYNLEDYEKSRADASFEERHALLFKFVQMRAANDPMIMVVGAIAVAAVIGTAAWRFSTGDLTGEQLIAFVVILTLLSQPARSIGTLNAVLQEGLAALERIFWVIDRKPEITDAADAKELVLNGGGTGASIEFADVRFAYPGGEAAIDDLSLTVPAGQMVALVGESGAGKSTIFNLLPRLYDTASGTITIDGQDLRGLTLKSLRDHIALVSQEAILFDDSVEANIRFGNWAASEEKVIAAAKAAAADEFIRALPSGYQTRVGDAGNNLSGGQRQRIALARAFLKDAPILLLDEATSALDAESERKVQEALARLTEGRTTIAIAHRLSTVRDADLICVMDRGQIVEQGTHEELLTRGGIYSRLAALQFRED
ncbi:ABC transporter permease [Aquisalinus flavus]|uniref:ABC transporter permease n=1 Tax=Aquisalinus flavus TaxID=1526572 RepID=A0A8J2Y7R6_9PROT|nr:ABC transporter ATP-binding protein [Aquisalinus flavus]MBD0428135.1 ABC transporter ATP-binding protein [Aquisalinus flavus]GGD18429.1 ABC transporter permease [Aquisalinus flavus]